jgi:hypothetical protein
VNDVPLRIEPETFSFTRSLRSSRPAAVYPIPAGFLVAGVLLDVPQFRSVLARDGTSDGACPESV